LAERAGVVPDTVNRVENASPNAELERQSTMRKLAEAPKMSSDSLVTPGVDR
jgi:hypothetical protein